jgi:glycerol-3-phosphate O-acyltransferase/dihydroxyacetone phosphate acyltransferase
LIVWATFALPGTILNAPVFILAAVISRRKAKGLVKNPCIRSSVDWAALEALAASTVKIAGRDVLATWKILIALAVSPVLYLLYASLVTLALVRAGAPMKWKLLTPILVLFGVPVMSLAALKFGEAGRDVFFSLRPLIVALLPGQQRSLERLKVMREQLANEVAEIINFFGPQIYEDFDRVGGLNMHTTTTLTLDHSGVFSFRPPAFRHLPADPDFGGERVEQVQLTRKAWVLPTL